MEQEKKRELVRSFTEAASKATGIDKSAFVVYLRKSMPDEVGVGGELLSDRQKK
jgi:4-oxalocrotonate tautomerase